MLFEFYDIYNFFFDNLAVKIKSLLLKSSLLAHSSKPNKLRNIYTIGRGAMNIFIKKWEIYYFKIKIIPFFIKFRRNYAIFLLLTSSSPKTEFKFVSRTHGVATMI